MQYFGFLLGQISFNFHIRYSGENSKLIFIIDVNIRPRKQRAIFIFKEIKSKGLINNCLRYFLSYG